MLLVPMNIFSHGYIMLWRGLQFDWANYVIFAACFMLRGRDTLIDFLRLLFLVGMNDDLNFPLMQERFLWPILKRKVLHCGKIAAKYGF